MRVYANNLPALIIAISLIMAPYLLVGSGVYSSLASGKDLISEITSVNEEQAKSGTTISIAGNGDILKHVTETHDLPPMIVIDIIASAKSLKSRTVSVKSDLLKQIRIGYHQKKIRIVLDIKGSDIPPFATKVLNNRLIVSLGTIDHEKKERDIDAIHPQNRKTPPQTRKILSRSEMLTAIKADDGQADTTFFRKAVNAYKEQDWQTATHELIELIKAFPEGRYAEKAYFLLAKACDNLHPDPVQEYFKEIKDHYDNAVKKFPESIFVPDAILSTGNLYFKKKSYHRAMTLYNLILKKHKDSHANLKALLKIVKIRHLKNKYKDAVSGINYIISNYPGFPEETEAKITMAKIAYEKNSFHKSINILKDLIKKTPENIYRYPEISLYLGYNYFQLGKSTKARINLLRFYNSCPDSKDNHLTLSKIGETYRNEGSINDAVKFYYLTVKQYPKTEGSLISQIRLAEQNKKRKIDLKIIQDIGSQNMGSPEEIYKDIINNPPDNNMRKSLAHLAMLRLAILYGKEKDYDKSIDTLKEFLKKYPLSSLKKEAFHTLNTVLTESFKEDLKRKQYISIINLYQRERKLILKIESPSPDLFLNIARAFKHLSLDTMAINMFKRADKFLPDMEKPPDLLYALSMDSFKKDKFEDAMPYLNLLIKSYPDDELTPYACKLKGEIFFKQGKFLRAANSFKLALKFSLKPCEKAKIWIYNARALIKGNSIKQALNSMEKADNLKLSCKSSYHQIYQDLGDLYLRLGYANKAIEAFNQALDVEEAEENKNLLKIKIARCYRLLNKREDYMPIYGEIASLENVLWSNIAKYEMEGIDFDDKIMKKSTK
ncbi:MAG: tetratricopeptide repeat protein [Thermodesulfobacteriota bacterium]|nr:tetratricopeptide repeat protein [Thermodesulfobacteriota bacterium]